MAQGPVAAPSQTDVEVAGLMHQVQRLLTAKFVSEDEIQSAEAKLKELAEQSR